MAPRADVFDLGQLRLADGEGRRSEFEVVLDEFDLSGQRYETAGATTTATLDCSRLLGGGFSLRLRFEAALRGPCMRCLQPAAHALQIDAREVHQPRSGDELDSPYVTDDVLALRDLARDSLLLALPVAIVCREDCAGLCAVCGADLNEAGPDHAHEATPDPRWAKLRELELE